MGPHSGNGLYQPGWLHRKPSGRATVWRLLAAKRSPAGRSTGNQTMILTREELAFLDVYCHEGTELPFGGPATDAMTSIGVPSGDTLNLQWAYLRDKPPTGPIIGNPSKVAPPLPWANREAVLGREAEIGTIREEMQARGKSVYRMRS